MGVLLFFGIILTFLNWSDALYINDGNNNNNELPCEFLDSINITNGQFQSDGAILFDGIKYSKGQFVEVDFLQNGKKRVKVEPHFRGCPCNGKPCINLCCPLGSFVNMSSLKRGTIQQTIHCYKNEAARNYESEVLDQNNQSKVLNLDENFSYVVLQSPIKFYKLKGYRITKNGQILHRNRTMTHSEYCLRADINNSTNKIEFGIFAYFEHVEELPTKYVLSATCMAISAMFILATIIVYTLLPELHNLHGSCLVCHLGSLIVAYILTAWVKFNGWHYVDSDLCSFRGYLMYFALLAAFLWSNVISYDLWRNFRATHMFHQFSDKNQFRFYMLYAWGLSLFFTLVILLLNHLKPFPSGLLPGVDINTCFLQKGSLLLYFYLPILIIFSVNIAYFTSTTVKICQIQRDFIKMTTQEESARHQTNLNNGRDDLTLYVRLFVITGVTWIMEGVSFLISPGDNVWFFRIFDVWNALQGLIIFISYIMKRRVLILIQKRYRDFHGKKNAKESFTLNSSSHKSTNLRLSLSSCDKSKYKEFR